MKIPEVHDLIKMLLGMQLSIEIFVVTWIVAFSVAVVLTVFRATGYKLARNLVDAFVEYQLNVPLLVHVFFWYLGIPEILPESVGNWLNEHDSALWLAAIALSLSSAAYIAEDIRSGLQAIPATQHEAARALGSGYLTTMRRIILPQALRHAIPALTGRALLLFKSTSVVMAIGVVELTYQTREIDNETYNTFAIFLVSTLLYLAGSFFIMFMGRRVQSYYRLPGGRHG